MTKPTAPSMRVAAIFCKGPIRERIRSIRVTEDMFAGGLYQELLLEFVSSSLWPKHLMRLREGLSQKCAIAVELVREMLGPQYEFAPPEGGLHLWIKLPDGVDEGSLVMGAAKRQVHISPGSVWFPAESPAGYIRLSYGGVSAAEIEIGIAALRDELRKRKAA